MRGLIDKRTGVIAVAACILVAAPYVSNASTVIPMSVKTMADHAGQVVVGTVVASRSYYIDYPRGIETEITLERVEYLKGKLADSQDRFTLRLPGGTVGGVQMRVCCAPMPGVGEKWLLLLLPEYKTYPTVGIYQGAFRVVADAAGVERVYRAASEPVTGLDAHGMVQISGKQSRSPHGRHIAGDRARVIELQPSSRAVQAMSLTHFRAAIKPMLATSKQHLLRSPAGRRIPTHYRAVPLQGGGGSASHPHPVSTRRANRSVSPRHETVRSPLTKPEKR